LADNAEWVRDCCLMLTQPFFSYIMASHIAECQSINLWSKSCFTTEMDLQCHLTTHNKLYPCPMCEQSFHVEYLLDLHMQNAHGNPTDKQLYTSSQMLHFKLPLFKWIFICLSRSFLFLKVWLQYLQAKVNLSLTTTTGSDIDFGQT
jgi:hypothetical protein